MPKKPDDLSDEEILYLVGQLDGELFRAGCDVKRRQWEVSQQAMRQLGYIQFVRAGTGKPGILERIEAAFKSIYRKQDVAMGGHIGVFMYRDIFARISVPHIYGRVQINPFNFVELTPVQLRIIQTEPEEISRYIDQFCDVADIEYGINELKAPFNKIELVKRFIQLARLQLHAAAAVVTGGYDYQGAVQSALLATELALKAGAATRGLDEATLRKSPYGHNLTAIADFVSNAWATFDIDRVRRVIAAQPQYVPNRYSAIQPTRLEVGHTIMGAQFIVSETVRQMSDRDFRSNFDPPVSRIYPR